MKKSNLFPRPITDCTNIAKDICDLIKYESIYVR